LVVLPTVELLAALSIVFPITWSTDTAWFLSAKVEGLVVNSEVIFIKLSFFLKKIKILNNINNIKLPQDWANNEVGASNKQDYKIFKNWGAVSLVKFAAAIVEALSTRLATMDALLF